MLNRPFSDTTLTLKLLVAMKNVVALLLVLGCLVGGSRSGLAQTSSTEKQALLKQLNQLMRDPAKPKQEVRLDINGCHAVQTIRANDASNVQASGPIAVSYNKGGEAGWAAKVANGHFELSLDFEWSEVTSLSYARNTDKKDDAPYEIKLKRVRKGSSTTFDLPLFTTDENVVRDLVRRLDKVRQSCQ